MKSSLQYLCLVSTSSLVTIGLVGATNRQVDGAR
jgi:hypothetical protein